MNKIAIPAILVATVMVAGMFAFMPVEQASTVHTSSSTTLAANSITAGVIQDGAIGANEIANSAIDAATFVAGAIDANALATDAVIEIGTLDRAFTWALESTAAATDIILIPAVAGKDIAGRIVLTQHTAVAGADCVVQSTDGSTALADGADITIEIVQVAFDTAANTPAGFITGEGIQIDVDALMDCSVTIFLETVTP